MERFGIRWGTLISWRRGIAAAVLAPAAVTLLAIPRDHPPAATVALLYVLAVVAAARLGGAIPGAPASVLSFLSLNFFFTSPLHTLVVGAPRFLVALFVFLIVAGVVGLLLSSAVLAKSKGGASRIRSATRAEAVVLAEPHPPPKPHRRVSEGRAEMMREMEAVELRESRRLRSERSRAYYREWNERIRYLRE